MHESFGEAVNFHIINPLSVPSNIARERGQAPPSPGKETVPVHNWCASPDNPYVGLRPFEEDDVEIFFGRSEHISELLTRLKSKRFVAVVGTSGSGKSSLVRAGLIPRLKVGQMLGRGGHWRIATFRPEDKPLRKLAASLWTALNDRNPSEGDSDSVKALENKIRSSSLGLVDAVRQAQLPPNENLLLVVDQFEELFRYGEQAEHDYQTERPEPNEEAETLKERIFREDDAEAFVKRLLAVSREEALPVYVLITMRSEFLGDCARAEGLPEAVNQGLYLTPRLTRLQLTEAIQNPLAMREGSISDALVQRLLNDITKDQDQLPVLQHALMRTWQGPKHIETEDYERVGGTAKALSNHAKGILEGLGDKRSKETAQRLFRCITKPGPDQKGLRRPLRLSKICKAINRELNEVKIVIHAFRARGNAFLMPPVSEALRADSDADTVIDISHESLIRKWDILQEWLKAESQSGEAYQRLLRLSLSYAKSPKDDLLLREGELRDFLRHKRNDHWNASWSERYGSRYNEAMEFLRKSRLALRANRLEQKQRQERERRNLYRIAGISLSVACILVVLFLWGWWSQKKNLATTFLLKSQESELPGGFEETVLLQVESMNLDRSTEKELPLRQALDLFPTVVGTMDSAKAALAVAFSGDEGYVASAGADGMGRRFDLATGKKLKYPECEPSSGGAPPPDPKSGYVAVAAAFDGDARYLAVGCTDGTVRVFNVARGESVSQSPQVCHKQVVALAVSPDDHYVAVGCSDGTALSFGLPIPRGTLSGVQKNPVATVRRDMQQARIVQPSSQPTPEFSPSPSFQRAVVTLAFSSDSRYWAAASLDGTARVFEAESKRPWPLLPHGGPVRAVGFSPDGRYLATASDDAKARLWNWQAGKQEREIPHEGAVLALAFNQKGNDLATGCEDGRAYVWHLQSNLPPARLSDNRRKNINAVVFSPDGHYLATANSDGTARVWDTDSERELARLSHKGDVKAIAFSPKGSYVATASDDGTARIFEVGTRHLRNDSTIGVLAVDFSADGQVVCTGNADGTVKLWNVGGEARAGTPTDAGSKGIVVVSSPHSSREPNKPQSSQPAFTAMDLSASGRSLVIGYPNGTARVCELQPDPLLKPKPRSVVDISAGHWNRTRAMDCSGRPPEADGGYDEGAVTSASLSRDGEYVAVAKANQNQDRTVQAGGVEVCHLSAETDQGVCQHLGYKRLVRALAFSSDHKYLAMGSVDWNDNGTLKDGRVEVFHSDPLEKPREYPWGGKDSVNAVVFSPNDSYLAVGGEEPGAALPSATVKGERKGALEVYNTITRKKVVHQPLEAAPVVVVFSPDSRYVATGDKQGLAHVFNLDTWEEMSEVQRGMLGGLVFRKNLARTDENNEGMELISAAIDPAESNAVAIKNHGKIEDVSKKACERLTRNLTIDEWRLEAGHWLYDKTCPNLPWPEACQPLVLTPSLTWTCLGALNPKSSAAPPPGSPGQGSAPTR
jgi:WD40 repeat protein